MTSQSLFTSVHIAVPVRSTFHILCALSLSRSCVELHFTDSGRCRRALSAAGASGGARAPLGGGGKPLSANPMGASLVRRPLPPSRPGGARFSAPAAAAAGKENTAG